MINDKSAQIIVKYTGARRIQEEIEINRYI